MTHLSDYKWINIFIDSNSFENYSVLKKIEWLYKNWDPEENPIHVYELYSERKSIILPTYNIKNGDDFDGWVKFDYGNGMRLSYITMWPKNIELMSEVIFKSKNQTFLKIVENLFIAEDMNTKDHITLFITDEIAIWKKKKEIEKRIKIKICSILEAEEIIWLFFRSRWEFYLYKEKICSYTIDQTGYYLYWFRNYVPFFHIDFDQMNITNEIFFKWRSLLKTVDEIWFLNCSSIGNNNSENTKYYFYIYLTLLCGIFDKLAIYTNNKLNLWFKEESLSLNPNWNRFKEFIKNIGNKNNTLKKLINSQKLFLSLTYKMRNTIVHNEGMQDINIDDRKIALKITQDIKSRISSVDTNKYKYHECYKNGILEDNSNDIYFLDPFLFTKRSSKISLQFINQYFQELWNSNFIESLNKNEDSYKSVKLFEEHSFKLNF